MVRKKRAVKKARVARKPAGKPKRTKPAAKRLPSRKPAARKPGKKAAKASKLPESVLEKIGEVTHYFPHVNAAAVLLLKDGLKVGDGIYIKGHTTDFKEKVESIQLDHVSVQEGRKGQEIGLLVKSRVRMGDSVYRL